MTIRTVAASDSVYRNVVPSLCLFVFFVCFFVFFAAAVPKIGVLPPTTNGLLVNPKPDTTGAVV